MAEIVGKKLSDGTIPVKSVLTGSEQIYINDAGVSKKTTPEYISDYIEPTIEGLVELKQNVFTGICQECYLTENDIVIDNTALTLTIATIRGGETISASNPIVFFTDGAGVPVKHTKTAAVVFTFTDTTGIWYFYFNSSGTAVATQTAWTDFATIATVWRFYWNATLSIAEKRVIDSVEYHKNDVSWIDHAWKHNEGTKWISGFDISSNKISSGTPATDGSNAVITLTTGNCIDDNLLYTVTNASSGVVKFTQNLGSGLLPATSGKFICISNDSSSRLIKIAATDFPFLWNSGTNTPEYLITDGTRTGVPSGDFFVYYVYCLQDPKVGESVKIKSAETTFASATLAAAHSWEQLQAIFPTLRDNEIRLLYKLTFEYRSTYDVGTKKTALRVVDDLRKQKITSTSVASGTIPASSIIVTAVNGLPTNGQSALEKLALKHIQLACSDETTALTAGTAKVTFRMPYAMTLTAVRASVTTAATGATLLTIDINEGGSSILSTKLTFDASEKTTTTAATPAVISDTALADDAEITVDIDSVGNTIAGAGLKITLIGY